MKPQKWFIPFIIFIYLVSGIAGLLWKNSKNLPDNGVYMLDNEMRITGGEFRKNALNAPYDCMVNPKKPQPPFVFCTKNCENSKKSYNILETDSTIQIGDIKYYESDFGPCKKENGK